MGWPTSVPFVSCRVGAYDSDMSYDLPTYIDGDGVDAVGSRAWTPCSRRREPFYKMAIERERSKAGREEERRNAPARGGDSDPSRSVDSMSTTSSRFNRNVLIG